MNPNSSISMNEVQARRAAEVAASLRKLFLKQAIPAKVVPAMRFNFLQNQVRDDG